MGSVGRANDIRLGLVSAVVMVVVGVVVVGVERRGVGQRDLCSHLVVGAGLGMPLDRIDGVVGRVAHAVVADDAVDDGAWVAVDVLLAHARFA